MRKQRRRDAAPKREHGSGRLLNRSRFVSILAILATATVVVGVEAAPAVAAPTQSASIAISPATQSQPTGAPQTYDIAVACQGTGSSQCGPDTTITIPLDTTTTPSMADPSWTYSATSGVSGLITSGPTVVGNNLVITLNDTDFIGGFSGTIILKATPPNKITPNNTSWSVDPTLTGGNIPATPAPTPAASTATASPLPVISKSTANGGSVYEAGSDVTYTITATCSNASTGNLEFESGTLTDPIPAGMTYVSSTPAGTLAGGAVTWSFPNAASTPAGCAPGATGTNTYQVVMTAPTPAPATEPIVNVATFSGTGADATVPAGISKSTSAQAPIQIVNEPPTGTGTGYASISKSSLAPLIQPGLTGNQYVATYPGNWLPAKTAPGYAVGAAAASFQVNVNYGLVDAYQTDILDPLPCLNDATGNVFASASYAGAACADPAFHPTVIQMASAGYDAPTNGLGAAVASGWVPRVILTDGSTVSLTPAGTVGASASSAYFTIPAADVDKVATIEVPPNAALMNRSLQLTMWGYTDPSLGALNDSLNELTNTATAIPQLDGTPETPIQDSASIFTVPENIQLGISKSFGGAGAGPSGTTVVNIKGAVDFPQGPLPHSVVLTDLLPTGLTWQNPATTGQFTLTQGAGQTTSTVTATIQDLQNYQGSGRELIRMTVPAADFTGPGSWTITPPNDFLEVNTPSALGIYTNTDQIFLSGLGTQQIDQSCTTPTQTGGGTSTATLESDNSMDLAGDGILNEDYCQNSANLSITGTGAAFALTKTVQGNLDTVPRGALGIGTASEGGSGTYVLDWKNVGSDNLNNAVVYDILPYLGDTGVSQGQAGVQRGSRFAPVFTGVGALPAGVTVQYSESTNPCRPEVFPDADNPGCVDDWGPAPANLADVKALEFTSTATYTAGTGFAVSVNVAVPVGVVNKIAWNSAATNAQDASNPSTITLPAEPPKVGLVAPATPTLATSTSDATVPPHTGISDSVTVTGTGGNPGSVAWQLVGPVAPVSGACTKVDWSGAPVVSTGTVPTSGDGTVTTGPVTLTAVGCYSWSDTLTPAAPGAFPTPPTIQPGAAHEVTLLSLLTPTITTHAASSANGSGRAVHDVITLSGTGLGTTPDSPTQASLDWTLHGPVAPVKGSCAGVSWSGALTADHGALTVTRDGQYSTPDTTLTAPGCYSYSESLAATADSQAVSTDPGVTVETILIPVVAGPAVDTGGFTTALTRPGPWTALLTAGGGLLLAAAALFITRRRRRRS